MAKASTRKTKHVMHGGPLGGQTLYLTSPGTLPFTLNGETGRYDNTNTWVPKPVDAK